MIQTTTIKENVISAIGKYLLDKSVATELGEAIFYDKGDVFFFYYHNDSCVAFAALNRSGSKARLKYIYVDNEYRGNGVFSELLEAIYDVAKDEGKGEITATSTMMALPMYERKGWEVTKEWKNYANIKKQL
jgi:GNAT superfamily N-acetyltransferase